MSGIIFMGLVFGILLVLVGVFVKAGRTPKSTR